MAVIIALISISIFEMLTNPYLKVRLYNKERITGIFRILVNGEEYTPNFMAVEYENSGKQRLNWSAADGFKINGGKYGMYIITLTLDNDKLYQITGDEYFKNCNNDIDIELKYFNDNWWNITDMNIKLDIYKIENDYFLNADIIYSYVKESDGTINKCYINEKFDYNLIVKDKKASIFFGI